MLTSRRCNDNAIASIISVMNLFLWNIELHPSPILNLYCSFVDFACQTPARMMTVVMAFREEEGMTYIVVQTRAEALLD